MRALIGMGLLIVCVMTRVLDVVGFGHIDRILVLISLILKSLALGRKAGHLSEICYSIPSFCIDLLCVQEFYNSCMLIVSVVCVDFVGMFECSLNLLNFVFCAVVVESGILH